ncbi:hypothetical protein RND71_012045 [Anisodus tanguticus]|uniref:Uncharacterized protein n=1 Tax=Anisodus tanguticus TaxID=243964 RepID=A0AAE1SF34_9SOLA|nr:hypothetical protein RND71_012045 [Anisodus tanguticus]
MTKKKNKVVVTNRRSNFEKIGSLIDTTRNKILPHKKKFHVLLRLFITKKSTPECSPDTSTSGNEYRALRRKYLLLEEESFALNKELREAEDEIKALEDEKLTLLDELVVLEGLVDPSEIQFQGPRL